MEELRGAIVAHTNHVAEQLAAKYADDAPSELRAWIRIAEQREAMVVAIYEGAAIERRLPRPPAEDKVALVVAKAIGSIWAQETSHTRLLGALRTVGGERGPRVEAIRGALEGAVTDWASARGIAGPIARWLIGLGQLVGAAPEFTDQIDAMRFDQFCSFSRALEETAAQGYARMLALIERIEPTDHALTYGILTRYEIVKILAEERFHAAVFEQIEGWLAPEAEHFAVGSPERCVRELRDLAELCLSVSNLRELAGRASALSRGPLAGTGWISDGGLGDLLRQYGFAAPVLAPPGRHDRGEG